MVDWDTLVYNYHAFRSKIWITRIAIHGCKRRWVDIFNFLLCSGNESTNLCSSGMQLQLEVKLTLVRQCFSNQWLFVILQQPKALFGCLLIVIVVFADLIQKFNHCLGRPAVVCIEPACASNSCYLGRPVVVHIESTCAPGIWYVCGFCCRCHQSHPCLCGFQCHCPEFHHQYCGLPVHYWCWPAVILPVRSACASLGHCLGERPAGVYRSASALALFSEQFVGTSGSLNSGTPLVLFHNCGPVHMYPSGSSMQSMPEGFWAPRTVYPQGGTTLSGQIVPGGQPGPPSILDQANREKVWVRTPGVC